MLPGRLLLTFVLLGAAALAAGCGSRSSDVPDVATLRGTSEAKAARALERGSGPGSSGSTGGAKLTPEAAILRFTKCLRDSGLDVPDPDVDSAGNFKLDFDAGAEFDPDDPKVKRARKACSKYADAIIQSFDPDDIVTLRDTLVRYAGCLRTNGYPVDDPNFLDPDGPFSDVDQSDPAFKRANVACESVLADVAKVLNG